MVWGGAEGRNGELPAVCRHKDLEAGRADEVVRIGWGEALRSALCTFPE